MGPRDSYICLIPKPLDSNPSFADDYLDTDVTPARSWSLLQPLAGTCLYVCCFLPSRIDSSLSLHSIVRGGLLILTATTMKYDNLKRLLSRRLGSQVSLLLFYFSSPTIFLSKMISFFSPASLSEFEYKRFFFKDTRSRACDFVGISLTLFLF